VSAFTVGVPEPLEECTEREPLEESAEKEPLEESAEKESE
jgi:hypothetical protein